MIRSILVPLDGSDFAEHALPLALTIARRAQARLHLVQVHQPATPLEPGAVEAYEAFIEPELRKREQAYLEATRQRLTRIAPIAIEATLANGPVTETLEKELAARQADLVVMTTHGRGMLSRFWLGSVADQLVRQSPAPVLLVRPHDQEADFSQDPPPRRVVIALDGSTLAEQVIPHALALASVLDAGCTFLRVVRELDTREVEPGDSAVARRWVEKLQELREDELNEARAYLTKVKQAHGEPAVTLTTKVVSAAQPAGAIVAEAGHGNIVALATHGRHGLPRLVLGSVADKVIRSAGGPVLVYRPRN
jgi:nucleotide-binding universal stress UspA family protein